MFASGGHSVIRKNEVKYEKEHFPKLLNMSTVWRCNMESCNDPYQFVTRILKRNMDIWSAFYGA